MSRVITFSRTFPSYHPRAGESTYFVEKFWNSIADFFPITDQVIRDLNLELPEELLNNFWDSIGNGGTIEEQKHHTVRLGHRFKSGDKFSPRVWSGKPYNSKQIIIGPDLSVKTFDVDIEGGDWFLNGRHEFALTGEGFDILSLATNDGLDLVDFEDWFVLSPDFKKKQIFSGQGICWNKNINY